MKTQIKNFRKKLLGTAFVFIMLLNIGSVYAQNIPAFPGAEGYGSDTPGGRGGEVIQVTNLNDSGSGSLRDAIGQSGARTVVFRVSGTIEMNSDMTISNSNITIVGQTAPGDGICLKNYKFVIAADDVVVRYLRFRRGNKSGEKDDTLALEGGTENVVVDHCSISWGCDETLNTWHGSSNITIQWCIISEALHHNNHGFAATLGGVNASYHHLLFANSPGRNPSLAGNNEYQTINMDFRNSVIFNFGHRTFDGKPTSVNIVNNYFKPGPNSTETYFASIDDAGIYEKIPTTSWYVSGNVWEGNEAITNNNHAGVTGATEWLVNNPNPFAPVQTVPAEDVYEMVLADVGAALPKRDSVDTRLIEEVRTGQTTFGDGVVLDPSDVGGWPNLSSEPAPVDSDSDGMPDSWETANGLNPNNASDRNNVGSDGYTMLEKYINSIGGGIAPTSPPPTPEPAPCGDVNSSGDVDIVDALLTAQFYVGLDPQPFNQSVADVSGDGIIDIIDALRIAQYYVGLITSFQGC